MYQPSERMREHLAYVWRHVDLFAQPQDLAHAEIGATYDLCYPEPEVIPDGE